MHRGNVRRELHIQCYVLFENPESNTLQNSKFTVTYFPSSKLLKWDEKDIRDISGEAKKNA